MSQTGDTTIQQKCEQSLAAIAGRAHGRLAPRATTALLALLRALRLPPGSEVLMPAMLCANPAHAVRLAGLRPVFADIEPNTLLMDIESAERMVGPDTRVLLAVPLFGVPLDVPALLDFAGRHGLVLVEDAAHAVGVSYANGQRAGSLGICSVYSFGTGKIAGVGEGAALLSDDPELLAGAAREMARLPSGMRNLSGVAAKLGPVLAQLPRELDRRRQRAMEYRSRFHDEGIQHTQNLPLWKYSLLLKNRQERDRLTRELLAQGVEATNLYPPLPLFFPEARPGLYPVATDLFGRIVNLTLG